MDTLLLKLLGILNVLLKPINLFMSYIGGDSRRLCFTSIIFFAGLMSLGIFALDLYYKKSLSEPADAAFYSGLDIAELESAVEYLEVCKDEVQASGKNKNLYCDFAKQQFSVHLVTHGKSGEDFIDAVENPAKYLGDYPSALIVNDGYSMMQAMLNSQKRRSENALRNKDPNRYSVFNFYNLIRSDYVAIFLVIICALCTILFALHAKRIFEKAVSVVD